MGRGIDDRRRWRLGIQGIDPLHRDHRRIGGHRGRGDHHLDRGLHPHRAAVLDQPAQHRILSADRAFRPPGARWIQQGRLATARVDALQRRSSASHQRAALKVGRRERGQRDCAVLAAIHLASQDRQGPGAPQLQLPRPPHRQRLGGVEGAEGEGGRRIAAVQQAGIQHLQGGSGGAVHQGDATPEGIQVGRVSLRMAAGVELRAVADLDAAIAHQHEASLGEHTDWIAAVVGGEARHGVQLVMDIAELEAGPGRRIEPEGLQHALPGVGERFQTAALHADRPGRGGVEQRDLPAAEGEGQPAVPVGSDAVGAGGPAAFAEQLARPDPDP